MLKQTAFRLGRAILRNRQIAVSYLGTMSQMDYFRGQIDRYNGVTVHSKTEPCPDGTAFTDRLQASLSHWMQDGRKTIWFYVDLSQAHWIPELTKNGFKFHHAKGELAVLYRWLPTAEVCNVPPYAHTNLGVGAVVLNDKTKEILVVREMHGISSSWKLPGGYVEPGENLPATAEREVLEETGIIAEFQCIVAFRHAHEYIFGCSDIYFISCLTPKTFEIKKCNREISECQWMKLEEFISHPNVHENNRAIASKVVEYLNHQMGLTATHSIHPLNKKPLCVFGLAKTDTT